MKPERLSLEELIRRYTVLQPPPNRFTLYAWREALGLDPDTAAESQELSTLLFRAIQEFTGDEKRRHRRINSMLLSARRTHDPVTEEMIEACRGWLARHAREVEEGALPAQGFSRIYALGDPEAGGCRVWERGEERLFVNDDRSGWAYSLSAMSPEEWDEFKRSVEVEDQFVLLVDLVEAINGLAGPDLPEDDRLTREDLDPACERAYEEGYPPLGEYLRALQEETGSSSVWESPKVQALMEALQGLEWADLAESIALGKFKLGRLSP